MRHWTRTICGAIALASLAAPSVAERLPGSEWEPVALADGPFEPEAEIFLRFEADGRFFGSGGCNSFRGGFVTNGTSILFGPAATTMKACPGDIMDQERRFLDTLDSARFFERDGTTLALSDAVGAVVLRLRQRDAD